MWHKMMARKLHTTLHRRAEDFIISVKRNTVSQIFNNFSIRGEVSDGVHRHVFQKVEYTFRKLDIFPSSGEGGGHLLCWIP
jgi:hypothetical protein